MKTYLSIIVILLLFACSDNDTNPETSAVIKACKACQTTPQEMEWLRTIIQANNGNIYAIHTSVGVLINHQPLVMSCVVCSVYSCSGTPVLVTSQVAQELQSGIKESSLIYEVKL